MRARVHRTPRPFHLSAITVFGRLSGYHLLIVRLAVARRFLWAVLSRRARHAQRDIMTAGIAAANAPPVVTRNRRDFFAPIVDELPELKLIDWSR